jgi:DNA invertase Pin-like site-specific DNA recombinase
MQMMQDCEAGKIDEILTKSLSRFARNTADCLELVRILQNLGFRFTSKRSIFRMAEMLDFQEFSPFLYAYLSLKSTN